MTTTIAAARPVEPTAVTSTLLGQFLVPCPGCGRTGAAHVDESGPVPTLVRFICPMACSVPGPAVLEHVPRP